MRVRVYELQQYKKIKINDTTAKYPTNCVFRVSLLWEKSLEIYSIAVEK